MSGLEGLLAGRVLGGRYLIEEVIGRGGMGAVYRAIDERLGRKVAVKVITMAGASDADARDRLRARFHREARAAAALPHHPNVVPVYDYGTDDTLGLDYLVMELLRGVDLATRLARSGAPPLPTALQILAQAARGLAVGHRAGLIHRDMKPGNIFLSEVEHGEVQVRVVDFGIAKLADEEDTGNQLTQDGRVPHSPAFASPEQLRGLSRLTLASDVFSLGAVGYLLLTGERPFSDVDRNRMSLGMPAVPPSLRSRNPAVPGSVDEIIQRALAFEPTERFRDASEFLAALDQAIRGMPDAPLEPYSALPIPTSRPAPPADDDRTLLAAPQVDEDDRTLLGGPEDEDDRTMIAEPVGAAGAFPGSRRGATTPPLPPRVEEPPKRRRTGLWVWLLTLLGLGAAGLWVVSESGGPSRVAGGDPEVVTDTMAVDSAAVADSVVGGTGLDARMYNLEGQRLFREGQYELARERFQRAVDLVPDNPAYRRNLAFALQRLGDNMGAEEELRRAIQLDPGLVVAHSNLVDLQLIRGDTAGAIASLEQFIESATAPEAARQSAENRLNQLREAQAASGLLGVPIEPPSNVPPDSVTQPNPPAGAI